MRIFSLFIVITGLLTAGTIWYFKYHSDPPYSDADKENIPVPDPIAYATTVADIQLHRDNLSRRYHESQTDEERKEVIASARSLLELTMPALMRYWLGTPWDFNGTATIPGDGKIACGYFVSIIMRDAGFNVQRVSLAQQASQNILLTFLPRKELQIKTGTPYHKYMRDVKKDTQGIYIIGLDKHVGFLVHDKSGLHFLHSGGLLKRVVDESEADAYSIEKSHYRVIGNVTANDEIILKWLHKKPFPTHR